MLRPLASITGVGNRFFGTGIRLRLCPLSLMLLLDELTDA